MHIIGAQLICLAVLFLSMLIVFSLPYWWIGRKPESFDGSRYQTAISLANCLSGGVFIATFFVGLMPEVREMFLEVLESYKISSVFPVTEFVIFIGFLLALGIEQCVLEYRERNARTYASVPLTNSEDNKSDLISSPVSCGMKDVCDSSVVDYDSDNPMKATVVKITNGKSDSDSLVGSPEKFHSHNNHHGHSHDIGQMLQGDSGIRLGMLMVSLGVHSLFEGLALGLQTSVATLLNLVIGVAVHELLVAFAMGVNVARLRLPKSTIVKLAILFAALIPIGQVFGIFIGYYQSISAVAVSAVLQGLAAGTFIHVTFLEVIPAEFNESGPRLLKVFFLGLGFMLLLFCSVFMQGSSHHHHH
ncbi:zinc transporter ZIP3-like [Uloborus diversus]|uniref:zinc transporter ZIP3-like n=1 Tax=Uloborus diversus TaxID=327109 RepID=UPI00240A846C|nr:zinc transporter ZIP3-like [Uloborus diversus]XP_054708286.1 zinc transporter ZIP3-like [Uloborus diversus]XP_054708287.1 zinc transporter ZIP3-like [Uloborus diversus]XP_054708288.1 zinc transporter ZIP3-like [Uloborus diversus]XP_054708289.1 zinc transporter ZIP3-like [Uloborus diversus]XP_054708290.1 zinc transporter ZIP3-like [Uloborus diversus]